MSLQDKIDNAKEIPWLRHYRPKKSIIYNFGMQGIATIVCYSRSKWLCINCDKYRVVLQNRNVTISLTVKEFKEHWVEWKEKK